MARRRNLSGQDEVDIAVMANDIQFIKNTLTEIKDSMVDKNRFIPIEKIVYGFVGVILLTVLGAILTLVVKTSVLAK